jgi:hypothetical protein
LRRSSPNSTFAQTIHGNLARIHALCLQSAFIAKLQKFKSPQVKLDDLKDSLAAIEALIGKSSQFFSLANCPWGTGLTNYQQAHFISTILIEADARPENEQALFHLFLAASFKQS